MVRRQERRTEVGTLLFCLLSTRTGSEHPKWNGNPQLDSITTSLGTSLVEQWLGIRLPMQGTWVRALVREDPACRGATETVGHNY